MQTDTEECDVSDPEVFWPMATYALHVQSILMLLRHLYTPEQALRWLTEAQLRLDNQVPADLLVTIEGRQRVRAVIQGVLDGAYL